MKKFFFKHETFICIILIFIYVILNSYCMQNFGLTSYKSAFINLFFLLIIIIFIVKNDLLKYYGLSIIPSFKKFLYFFPLLLIVLTSLLGGVTVNNSVKEIIFFIFSMIGVGFLEEIIFRGFLFKMMEKESVNSALLVTSLTFGIGHIVNLLNGAPLVITIIQICYCFIIGYLFALIFYKGKSLWPCIITHILLNALSIFTFENIFTLYISPLIFIIISLIYIEYIKKVFK